MFHGSRDARPEQAVKQLAQQVSEKLGVKGREGVLVQQGGAMAVQSTWYPQVGTAALECTPIPLAEQIRQFASQVAALGCDRLQIIPLFLLPGNHVMEDIPEQVAIANSTLGNFPQLLLAPYLGSHPRMAQLLLQNSSQPSTQKRILLAHGSRRPGSHQPIEALAQTLNAIPAYWSVEPSLAQQVESLVNQGYQQIEILPYFLFAGGITEAIADQVAELQTRFSTVHLDWGKLLEENEELVDLIIDLAQV